MQRDSTYMFNFEGLIPKICLLAQEMGEDERVIKMRCAGLQALSAMVNYQINFLLFSFLTLVSLYSSALRI